MSWTVVKKHKHFYRDTGYVRPGKDCRKHDIAERQAAFDKWNKG